MPQFRRKPVTIQADKVWVDTYFQFSPDEDQVLIPAGSYLVIAGDRPVNYITAADLAAHWEETTPFTFEEQTKPVVPPATK